MSRAPCEGCGASMDGKRSDARYHSPDCKRRHYVPHGDRSFWRGIGRMRGRIIWPPQKRRAG